MTLNQLFSTARNRWRKLHSRAQTAIVISVAFMAGILTVSNFSDLVDRIFAEHGKNATQESWLEWVGQSQENCPEPLILEPDSILRCRTAVISGEMTIHSNGGLIADTIEFRNGGVLRLAPIAGDEQPSEPSTFVLVAREMIGGGLIDASGEPGKPGSTQEQLPRTSKPNPLDGNDGRDGGDGEEGKQGGTVFVAADLMSVTVLANGGAGGAGRAGENGESGRQGRSGRNGRCSGFGGWRKAESGQKGGDGGNGGNGGDGGDGGKGGKIVLLSIDGSKSSLTAERPKGGTGGDQGLSGLRGDRGLGGAGGRGCTGLGGSQASAQNGTVGDQGDGGESGSRGKNGPFGELDNSKASIPFNLVQEAIMAKLPTPEEFQSKQLIDLLSALETPQ